MFARRAGASAWHSCARSSTLKRGGRSGNKFKTNKKNKMLYIVTLYRTHTRALTFENFG